MIDMASSSTPARDPAVCETEFAAFQSSPIHGTGGYARQDIAAGTRVIEYVGERINKAEALIRCEANNEYIFTLNDEWDLDGNQPWNPARFINHSCAPNCEAEIETDNCVWIATTRDIKAGEELTFNYGYGLEDYLEHPCRCGATACVGFIVAEEFFGHLRSPVVVATAGPNGAEAVVPAVRESLPSCGSSR